MYWVLAFIACLIIKSEIITLVYLCIGLVAVMLKFFDQFEVDG